ncbi:phospho-N-acetylmuramoyl-pentapeptide-transferase [Pelagibacteraceae bacterium]|jgi:phospho-N-acetylmuramoyl-pentapeptide-transferase|nr:phospho-N-acetylmuramoyl-pentapeptide-transferase [Pelagibacteraceae bacterium]MDC1159067.1 phospho-N-acetylmuramoyl-pentapeptide-transferase [Pelagibacteraceae bacterium]
MLFNLLTSLIDQYSFLNVFKYLTFRTGLSVITSLVIVFIIGGPLIKIFSENLITGPIRQDGPIDHIIKKSGTPTMGGVIIIIGIVFSTILWADLKNIYIWTLIFVSLSLGGLGLLDDILKIKFKNSRGLKSRYKFFGQFIISAIALFIIIKFSDHKFIFELYFPFFKNFIWHMGLFFIPFGLFVIIGASNAVNLTDGLDGLATVPVMLVALSFTLISYVVGNTIFSEYLQIQYIPDVGELSIFCGSIVGSCLGFLWYNAPPAKIFMGDTGSLSLGGSLAAVAIIVKHEIVLAIIGGLFVLETASVIIQVVSFKLTGRRIFKMAPIHHHFEKKGWAESTIVIRFWIIAIILALVGLATLKLR